MKGGETYTLAYACCDVVLLEDGKFPTIDAIRERIGINSPVVIKRAINDWTLHFVEKHRKKLLIPNMPTLLMDATEALWQLCVNEASKSFEQDKSALTQREAEWQNTLTKQQDALKTNAMAWETEKQRMMQELSAQTDLIKEFSLRLDDTVRQLDEANRQLNETRQALSHSEGSLAEVRDANTKQMQDWTIKFEKDHQWHLNRITEEKQALATHYDKVLTDKQRALDISQSKQDALAAQMTQIMDRVGDSLERQAKLETEVAQLKHLLTTKDHALKTEQDNNEKLRALVKRQRQKKSMAVEVDD